MTRQAAFSQIYQEGMRIEARYVKKKELTQLLRPSLLKGARQSNSSGSATGPGRTRTASMLRLVHLHDYMTRFSLYINN